MRLVRSKQAMRPLCGRPTWQPQGFTLIEAAIVTVIVGVGIVGILQLLAAGTMANNQSTQLTTAIFLANNINERLQGHDYNTLHANWDNKTFNPPIDARGNTLATFTNWTQIVDVQYVDPDLLSFAVPDSQVEPMSRVTVQVQHKGSTIYTASWIIGAPE